jgi:hypothetical protein
MNPNKRKTLILGMAVGMKLEDLAPFFLSLEKAGYHGDVCLCVADLDSATLDFLHARNVNLVPFRKAYLPSRWSRLAVPGKWFMNPHQRRQFEEQILLSYLHLHCARHIYCREYLAECGGIYDRVMLADTRDILFQSDPFEFELPAGLSVFVENPSANIGSCFTNATWIRNGFGEKVLKELSDKTIYCSGTIFGSPENMLAYFEQVLKIYAKHRPRQTIDQATHNYIMHQCPPPGWRAFDNDSGPVLTMAKIRAEQIRFNQAGLVVNAEGRIYSTLHQYDRHPELARRLRDRLT